MSEQASKVSGVVQIDGTPAQRIVRAFGYETQNHDIDGANVTLSRSLGHAASAPETGEYTINLLGGYDREVFVVAFDDYGADFGSSLSVVVGDRVHPTTPNGYVWECVGAGTLPAEEPQWVVDTETAQLYGTASMIARPFYRPMVHGPVAPEIIAFVPSYYDEIMSLGPIQYFRFDEEAGAAEALDELGGLSATYYGNPTMGADSLIASHPDNSAMQLDGVDDFVQLTARRRLSDRSLTTVIVAVFKGYGPLISNQRESRDRGAMRISVNSDGSISIAIENNNTDPYNVSYISAGTIDTTKTNMVAVSLVGYEYRIHINGELDSTHAANYTIVDNNYDDKVEVGRYRNFTYGGTNYFSGVIDDLAIFDKALTDTQIADLYAEAFPVMPPSTDIDPNIAIPSSNLLAFWDMEGSGLTAPDSTGVFNLDLSSEDLRSTDSFELKGALNNPAGSSHYAALSSTANLFGFTRDFEVFFAVKPTAELLSSGATILCLAYRSSGWADDNNGLIFNVNSDLQVAFRVDQGNPDGFNGGSRGTWNTGAYLKPDEYNLVFCSRGNDNASVHIYNSDGLTTQNLNAILRSLSNWQSGYSGVLSGGNNSMTPSNFAPPEIVLDYMGVYDRQLTAQEREDLWTRVGV